jgi:hypothetical protein
MHPQTPTNVVNPTFSVYKAWRSRYAITKHIRSNQPAIHKSRNRLSFVQSQQPLSTTNDLLTSLNVLSGRSSRTPVAITNQISGSSSSITAQRRVTYFVRRGNKARRESLFRSLWTSKRKLVVFQKYSKYRGEAGQFGTSPYAREATNPSKLPSFPVSRYFSSQRRLNQNRRKRGSIQENSASLDQNFFTQIATKDTQEAGFSIQAFSLAVTPYAKLVGRRRGRRTVYKIRTVSRAQGRRQSLISLANTRRAGGAASKPFVDRFKKQRATILSSGAKDRKAGQASTGSLRDKRDELHQNAFSQRPAHWRHSD